MDDVLSFIKNVHSPLFFDCNNSFLNAAPPYRC